MASSLCRCGIVSCVCAELDECKTKNLEEQHMTHDLNAETSASATWPEFLEDRKRLLSSSLIFPQIEYVWWMAATEQSLP